MILYLTSQECTNLLDFYSEKEAAVPVKKITGKFVLKQFVIHDMRNFSHFSDLVLDRSAFMDSDEEFVEALEEFKTMYSSRITVIAIGANQDDTLITALLGAGIGNIVTVTNMPELREEIEQSLSELGLRKYHTERRTEVYQDGECYNFTVRCIKIAVAASQSRIGATTMALGLVNWLCTVGGPACYVEKNESGHMKSIIKDYEMERGVQGYTLDGAGYYTKEPVEGYQFIVADYGVAEGIGPADIMLLVCGTKPYELSHTISLLHKFNSTEAVILCPFVEPELRKSYVEAFETDYHKVMFLEYQPDCLNGLHNANVYKTIIKKYIAE